VSFTLHVENLRALRQVEWSPEGVCALVGANGSGKSTLLQVLRFLNLSITRGVEEAFRQIFISSYGLRNRSALDVETIRLGISIDGATWTVRLSPAGGSIAWPAMEVLDPGKGPRWMRAEGSSAVVSTDAGEEPVQLGSVANLAIEILARQPGEWQQAARSVVGVLERLRIYHDPDLWTLRTQGSSTAVDSRLHSWGLNTFAVLRTWNERREHRHRQQFVLDGMRAAFPNICGDFDFESAGQTTFLRLYPPGSEQPTPIANEANGVLAMLIYLCDIASGEPGGVVAIDEPENSLHPHALRVLVESAQAWSETYDCTVVLATHSPVILNELTGFPERVWVMQTSNELNPTRLDRLKNPEWLRHFALGTLYASGELGSNDDAA
jgi:energy-coupling factor transporter ATP-binding protein EcfA2